MRLIDSVFLLQSQVLVARKQNIQTSPKKKAKLMSGPYVVFVFLEFMTFQPGLMINMKLTRTA